MEIENRFQPYLDNIASYFKKIKGSSIGIDIGGDNLKIVKLKKTGGVIKLENYAIIKIKEGLNRQELRKISGKIVKKVLGDMGIKDKKINIAIPSYSSLITLMEVSGQTETEIKSEIEYEAPKYIPADLSEVLFDWQIIETEAENSNENQNKTQEKVVTNEIKEKQVNQSFQKKHKNLGNRNEENILKEIEGKNNKILLVSTMKNVSDEYQKSFDENGLDIDSIEVDCFSIQRSLLKGQKGNYLIIDMGGKVTNIIGIHKGQLLFNRNIDLAGDKLTELIAKSLNVEKERAEKMKLKQGMENDSVSVNNNIIEPFFTAIANQAQKSIDKFDEFKGEKLDKVILTGGVSETIGLKDFLKDKMKADVVYGNPWAGIEYPAEIKDKLLSTAPFFGVAVGLALIDLE